MLEGSDGFLEVVTVAALVGVLNLGTWKLTGWG